MFFLGEVAEWSIAAVLKTVDPKGSGGSNPSLSAKEKPCFIGISCVSTKNLPFLVFPYFFLFRRFH